MAITIFLHQRLPCAARDTFGRCQASKVDPTIISKLKYDGLFLPKHNLLPLRDFTAGLILRSRRNINVAVHASVPPQAPFPAGPSLGDWKIWMLGALVPLLLSFSRGKWGPLLKLKEKVDATIEKAEQISDIVEEVAEKVDQVAEEAAKHLPEGKLQDVVEFIEETAEKIDKRAEQAGDLLEKVEEIGNEVDKFLDSTTHKEQTVVASAEAKDQK